MGSYTKNLFKKNRPTPKKSTGGPGWLTDYTVGKMSDLVQETAQSISGSQERLVSCAIIRGGETHSRGFKEHWRIRAALNDEDPYTHTPGDQDGFLTSEGRFIGRREAVHVGHDAGQCQLQGRELLSSDINWDGIPGDQV